MAQGRDRARVHRGEGQEQVRMWQGPQLAVGVPAWPDFHLLCPIPDPELPQQPRFPGLSSALCPPASYTDSPPDVQGKPPQPVPRGAWLFPTPPFNLC